jgi:MHS family proline/betaine transporter-like MFS transporter
VIARTDPNARRAMIAVGLSTVVEWYDFTLCLYFAPTLARVFFGAGGESLGKTLAGFAIAYLMRPLGAIAFGQFGDRRGRKPTLLLSMTLMTVSMLVLALLPTHAQIGASAGWLLIVMRCLMGFSVGGEYPAVVAYLFETAPVHRRGLVTSSAAAASEIGGLLAVGLCAWLTTTLPQQSLDSWGWRIPFLFGAGLAAAIWLLRRLMPEPPAFVSEKRMNALSLSPIGDAMRNQRRGIGIGFAISALGSISYYVGITYVPSFVSLVQSADEAAALELSTVAALVVILVTPCIGWLSDRIGRRTVLLGLCALCAVLPVAMFPLIANGGRMLALSAVMLLAALAGGVSAVGAVTTAEQFPARTRLSGLALGATTATAVFGGAAPYGAYLLQNWSNSPATPGLMIGVVAIISGLVLARAMKPHSDTAFAP